jgi:hypothetical protein
MNRIMQRVACFPRVAFLQVLLSAALALGLAACNSDSTTASNNTVTAAAFEVQSTVTLAASTYSVQQPAGSATVTVNRTGTASGATSVSYATADGTALAGVNYTATSGTLQWAENDSTSRTITVPVSNTPTFSGSMTFTVLLSNPSTGAAVGEPGTATVTITGDAPLAAGNVAFADAAYTVAQNAGTVTVSVNRTGGSGGAVSVAYSTANGSGVAGTDYTATSGTLNWADGDSTAKTFSVAISNATPFIGSKAFTVALSAAGGGADLGTPTTATVSITGDASPPVGSVDLSAASYSVAQSAGSLTITVNRTGGSSGAISVAYATSNGTAVAGTDYSASSGTLQWANADSTAKTFSVPISNATPYSGNKTFTLTLSGPTGAATIASPGSATVTITGDAVPPVGTLELTSSTYAVAQGAGSLTVTVNRAGGSNGAISVGYATSNGSAVAGTDYSTSSGTLQWANGDTSSKTFSVAISNATPFSGNKSFTTTLSSPTGGATLSSPSSATVTITGDAVAAVGSLQFSGSTYSVGQAAGTLTVTVNRVGGSSGTVGATYATSDGTAVAGTNYTASSGTVQWAGGDATSKTFSVAISDSTPFSGTKAFTVTLSAPTGGATLGSPTSATATVTGNATTGSTTWTYYDGVMYWPGNDSVNSSENYTDTAGAPLMGPYDVAVQMQAYGEWQPALDPLGTCVSYVCLDTTPYNYFNFAFKPTNANEDLLIGWMSAHDTPDGGTLADAALNVYCTNCTGGVPAAGQWNTYKVPLSVFGLTDTTVLKFWIQEHNGISTTMYFDNVGLSSN